MKISMIKESMVNTLFGRAYYTHHSAPLIKKHSVDWKNRWNNRKACLLLSYDIDDKNDMVKLPKLLKLLKKYKIKAGFAAIGLMVEKNPEIFRKIIREGHELINHTYTHPDSEEFNIKNHFHEISAKERYNEIEKCDAIVRKKLKYKMTGFRIPHFGNQYAKDIYPMLKTLGYAYSSSTVAIRTETEGFPYKISNVWEFPMACCPKHPFCIFDTSHAFRSTLAKHKPKEYLETFESLIDFGIKNGMFINLYQDPQDIDRFDYEQTLKLISKRRKDLWITTYKELVEELKRR